MLYDKVYTTLKKQIETGYYGPGELIPSEQELMELFGVSRVTTTRALRRLVAENLVVRRVGAGTFVSDSIPIPHKRADTQMQVSVQTDEDTDLGKSSQNLVGLVIPQLWGRYSVSLITTAERLLQEKGFVLAVSCSYGDQQVEQRRIEELLKLRVKGLIIFPTDGPHYNEGLLRLFVNRFPTVIVDKQLPGVPFPRVVSDNYGGAKRLANHLLESGHRRMAFVSLPLEGTSTLVDRWRGFEDALNESRVKFDPNNRLDTLSPRLTDNEHDDDQFRLITEFIRQRPEVTAIFSTRYELAQYIYQAALELGRKVPDDLSIVCFDGSSRMPADWEFTHVAQNGEAVASEALTLLFYVIESSTVASNSAIVIPTEFYEGSTTSTKV